MLNIKQYLKNAGITQKEFSERIGLSRPTLDAYIEMFEKEQDIPKERYNIIFKRLFDQDTCSIEEFKENLQQIENLLSRDQKYGTSDLEPEAADFVSLIVRNMKKDLKNAGWNKDVYIFMNILISNYRKNEIFKQLVEYFIYLNGIKEIENVEENQIPYFANMYKAFHGLTIDSKHYDQQDYDGFVRRCFEIREDKNKQISRRRDNLKERIQSMIVEFENKGIELSEEEIIEAVKNQIIEEKMNNSENK